MRRARAAKSDAIFILLIAYGTVETAVQAMKEGAYDYLTKLGNLDELDDGAPRDRLPGGLATRRRRGDSRAHRLPAW